MEATHPVVGAEQRAFFRGEMREARARVLADAEAYATPLHVLERMGRYLNPEARSLWHVHDDLCGIATKSPLANAVPDAWSQFHRPFAGLLGTIRHSRNDVMHTGAKARHLTNHLVEACLILEDALAEGLNTIAHFMVPEPVIVADWQPVSLLRLRMLGLSFTYVPVRPTSSDADWVLVADHQLARFLGTGSRCSRKRRLVMPVREALDGGLESTPAEFIPPDTPVAEAIRRLDAKPMLVGERDQVVGIVTAFDLI